MDERVYDLIFICRPATPEEEVNKIVATLEHSTGEHGGKIEKTEKWGTRRLAYRVAKHREGFFVYMVVKSTQGDLIKELERRLKVSDPVIKYQTIRLDEELKRQQKLSKHRERRASRRRISGGQRIDFYKERKHDVRSTGTTSATRNTQP